MVDPEAEGRRRLWGCWIPTPPPSSVLRPTSVEPRLRAAARRYQGSLVFFEFAEALESAAANDQEATGRMRVDGRGWLASFSIIQQLSVLLQTGLLAAIFTLVCANLDAARAQGGQSLDLEYSVFTIIAVVFGFGCGFLVVAQQ